MLNDNTPIIMVPKIAKWAKRGGKIRKYGNGANRSGGNERHYTRLLVENAIALGWFNGHRRRKGPRNAAV